MRLAIFNDEGGLLQKDGTFSWSTWGNETIWLTEDREAALMARRLVEVQTKANTLIVDHDFHNSICYYEGQGWYDHKKEEWVA